MVSAVDDGKRKNPFYPLPIVRPLTSFFPLSPASLLHKEASAEERGFAVHRPDENKKYPKTIGQDYM